MKKYGISALLIILLFSCSDWGNRGVSGQKPDFYAISDGRFRRVPGMTGLAAKAFLPWTGQERVSDIAFDSGKILFAINRYGIAFIDTNETRTPSFHYFFDAALFSGKTITTIIPYGDDAACHFYYNTSLGAEKSQQKPRGDANFAFFPVKGVMDRFTKYALPFEKSHDGFEAVGFLPVTKVSWMIEWKHAGKETVFDYTRFDMAGRVETAISREDFRNAYLFKSIAGNGIAPELTLVSREAASRTGTDPSHTTYHFFIKVKDSNLTERYTLDADLDPSDSSYEIVNVSMFRDEKGIYALSGDGALLSIVYDTDAVRETALPELPIKYGFTSLFVHGNTAYLPWEESSFYKTGNAGLAIVDCSWK